MNKCYCGNDKKKFSKVCVKCSNKLNKLRSLAVRNTEIGIGAKKELDIILEKINNFYK